MGYGLLVLVLVLVACAAWWGWGKIKMNKPPLNDRQAIFFSHAGWKDDIKASSRP